MRFLIIWLMAGLCIASNLSSAASIEWTFDRPLINAVEFAGESAQATLAENMKRYGVPGVSIARIEDNTIITLDAIGLADVATGRQLSPQQRFQAASISKPVAATGVMVLVGQQRVKLDGPVNEYLSSWTLPDSAFTKDDPVTLREALSHGGGISVPSYPGFERGAPMPSLLNILNGDANAYSDPVAVINPQNSYRYSGGGYMLLQQLIEDVTGQDFELFMQQAVFQPARMNLSTFRVLDNEIEDLAGITFGHDGTGERRTDPWQDYPQAAPAGLWSTPEDLAKWLITLGSAYQSNAEPIITHTSARAMARRETGDTGLGFGVHGQDDALHLSHTGWTIGYRSNILYFPARGEGVVIMTNSDSGHLLINDLIRTLGREHGWPGFGDSIKLNRARWTEQKLDHTAGIYRMQPAGFSIQLARHEDAFELTTPRGSSYRLVPVGPHRLVIEETGEFIERDAETGELALWGMTGTPVSVTSDGSASISEGSGPG
ncbi:MAG: serine hydrolase domain-containing protein [Pseudomonadota bacterium]